MDAPVEADDAKGSTAGSLLRRNDGAAVVAITSTLGDHGLDEYEYRIVRWWRSAEINGNG